MVDVEIPAHLSHSQASALIGESCPAQYWFERVLGKPSVPGWAALGGSALHTASEDWDHAVLQGLVEVDSAALHAMFGKRFDEQIAETEKYTPYPKDEWHRSGRQGVNMTASGGPNKKDEAWWRQWGPQMLAAYAAWRLTSSWEIAAIETDVSDPAQGAAMWGIEVPFECELGGVPVRGYIDRVFHQVIDGEDVYLVVDLKSGKEPDTTAQLGTYRAGLVKQYGIDPRYGSYWLGGTGGSTSFADLQAQWPVERVEKRFAAARRRQLAGEFDCAGCWICKQGGIRDYVASSGGSKAHTVPQPWEVGTVTVAAPK